MSRDVVDVDLRIRQPGRAFLAALLYPNDRAARARARATFAAPDVEPRGPTLPPDRQRAANEELLERWEAELAELGMPADKDRRAEGLRFLATVDAEAEALNDRLAAQFVRRGGLGAILGAALPGGAAYGAARPAPREALHQDIRRLCCGPPLAAARLLLTHMRIDSLHRTELRPSWDRAAQILQQVDEAAIREAGGTETKRLRTYQEHLEENAAQAPLLAAALAEIEDVAGRVLLESAEFEPYIEALIRVRARLRRVFSFQPAMRQFLLDHLPSRVDADAVVEYRVVGGLPRAAVPLQPLPAAVLRAAKMRKARAPKPAPGQGDG